MRCLTLAALGPAALAAALSCALAGTAESTTPKPPNSNLILDPPKPRPAPAPAQPSPAQPAQADPPPAAAAPAAQQPLRQLLLKGYEVKNLTIMTLETTKQYSDKATQPGVVLTLQKATSAAVCYYGLSSYMSLTDSMLDAQSNCDVRGPETDTYEFVESPQNAIAMFRLNTLTGEVGYCFYARAGDQPGQTVCNPPAPEAQGAKEIGAYKLIAHKRDDSSVFRVNLATGAMSICYPLTENNQTRVWCTNYAR